MDKKRLRQNKGEKREPRRTSSDAKREKTERALRESLRESEEFKEILFMSSRQPIVVMNARDNRFIDCNQAAVEIYRFRSREDAIGKTPLDVSADVQYDGTPSAVKAQEYIDECRRKGSVFFEWRHRRPDGEIWDAEVHLMSFSARGMDLMQFSLRDISGHRRAEEALSKAQSILFAALDQSPAGVLIAEADTRQIRLVNRAAAEILAMSEQSQMQLSLTNPSPMTYRNFRPDGTEYALDELPLAQSLLTGRSSSNVEMRVLRHDGSERWILVNSAPIYDKAGAIIGGICIFTDITRRKNMEEARNRSEAFMNAIIEHSPISMWVSDNAGTLMRMNQACRDLLHVTDEELVGKYNLFRDNIVAGQGLMPLVRKVFERGEKANFTLHYDSSRFTALPLGKATDLYLDVTISPVLDAGGRVVNAIVQHLDVTETKRAQDALRVSEERYRMVSDMSDQILYDYDIGSNRISWAGNIEKILGFAADNIKGFGVEGWQRLIHPKDRPIIVRLMDEAMRAHTLFNAEYRYRKKDGSYIHIAHQGVFFYDSSDSAVRMIGSMKDETYRKYAEQERIKLQEQLQQAMKMEAVGRLAGGVAHDFNNLLTAILGNADLARMHIDPANQAVQHLDEVSKAAESAASLTRQLLAFSRRQIIEPAVVNLNTLVGNLQKMMVRLIGEDIAYESNLSKNLASVRVDPGQFEQVLLNLAINARDAMPDGGRLLIETADVELDREYCVNHPGTSPGKCVMLAISDTGHGMTDEVKRHLFEPFYTTKSKGKGTGLGLAMIFGAIKQAGGAIEVYSEVGLGTTFKLYLPQVVAPAEELAAEESIYELPTGSETILLVEDQDNVRALALEILRQLGYRVLEATNGGEALMLAEEYEGAIDLLLTDVVMPGMNGRELAERLVTLYPSVKVLFTSGYTENIIVHHGIIEEKINFIGKPYTLQSLAKKIRDVMGSAGRETADPH